MSPGIKHFVCPDLDPNCLQRLSADNKNLERVKSLEMIWFNLQWRHAKGYADNILLSADFFQNQLF